MAKQRTTIPEPYKQRIEPLRQEISRRRLDAYLILDRLDQIWLTGFTGEDGLVLVTANKVVLLTDGRFSEAADRQAPYARKVLRKQRTAEVNAREIAKFKLNRIGFDPTQLSVADHTELRKRLRPTKLVPAGGIIGQMRACKNDSEVRAVQLAIDVAQTAFQRLREWLRFGKTEREIAARLEYEMKSLGAQGPSFPTIVACGANSSLPHYEVGDGVFTENTVLLIDWGAQVGWYCSDLTRMIWPPQPPKELADIHRVVQAAHDEAIAAARAGMTAHELDRVARRVIVDAGYGKQFNHATGHGLGLAVHEAPRVGAGTRTELKPGMIITVEPGIYLPGIGGVRIEDDILITQDGHRVLSSLPVDQPTAGHST